MPRKRPTTSIARRCARLALLLPVALLSNAAAADAACREHAGVLTRGCQSIEISGLYQWEIWDPNESNDAVAGVSVTLAHALFDGWIVGGEIIGVGVVQSNGSAFVGGGIALVRRRLLGSGRFNLFADAGLGFSYADAPVPLNGTRFNYLLQTGVGAARGLTRRVDLIGHLRHLHVSNNGLAGRRRNPDIRGLGVQAGLAIRLGAG
jgi:hypothetical protein